ncbi:BON domain-containing protein [Duganella sp. FT109W]|uniref:BON domain-containing protein n=3 Tax=Duganella margarita TaxID=2692170 RepID=A0ABW9WQ82_9BURK|nr:BON domain-containing protein [Duganella margarita]MYN43396.1 BON domain-containing protein [Duganella margarita]
MHTDSDIRKHVESELEWDADISANDIGVAVREKIVTLSGFVRSYAQKVAAERAAQRVAGVAGVADELEVRLAGEARLDADIAREAASALRYQLPHSADAIQLVVDDGTLKLKGEVEWNYQRERAEQAVRRIRGVRQVLNQITLHPTVAAADVQHKIVAAFHRNAALDAARLRVEASGNTVTLHGNVRSWSERKAAERAAWLAPGVTHVNNLISIDPTLQS